VISMSSSARQKDRNSALRPHPRQLPPWRDRAIPVNQEALLLVELEAHEFCIDLSALSQLVLSDLGATLQVLRLAGREFGYAASRSTRMEDCVASLGVQTCLDAASAQLIPHGEISNSITELWRHSSEIARQSKQIAEETVDIDPEQAYLVGLCHAIGRLPAALGWSGSMNQRHNPVLMGLELAREWSLPPCIFDYFSDLHRGEGRCLWPEIVKAAHDCIGQRSAVWLCMEDPSSQLRWAV